MFHCFCANKCICLAGHAIVPWGDAVEVGGEIKGTASPTVGALLFDHRQRAGLPALIRPAFPAALGVLWNRRHGLMVLLVLPARRNSQAEAQFCSSRAAGGMAGAAR